MNLFLPANIHKRDLHQIHMMAWKRGVKSLYYCRSLSIQRADTISEKVVPNLLSVALVNDVAAVQVPLPPAKAESRDYEECLACQ